MKTKLFTGSEHMKRLAVVVQSYFASAFNINSTSQEVTLWYINKILEETRCVE